MTRHVGDDVSIFEGVAEVGTSQAETVDDAKSPHLPAPGPHTKHA